MKKPCQIMEQQTLLPGVGRDVQVLFGDKAKSPDRPISELIGFCGDDTLSGPPVRFFVEAI
jgi:hypothetical protein